MRTNLEPDAATIAQGDLFWGWSRRSSEDAQNQSPLVRALVRKIPGTAFTLYENVSLFAMSSEERMVVPEDQLGFDFEPVSNVIRFIPRSHSAYLNRPIESFFARDRAEYRAARALVAQGILYVGDMVCRTRAELARLLGPRSASLNAMEDRLLTVGISLDARSPWWCRPLDYYGVSL
jgi:hypothetical protein